MKNKHTRRGLTQRNHHIIICPPCGESAAQAAKEGQNRKNTLWSLLPRLTAVLPPQGRGMSRGFTLIELLVVVLIIGILAAVAVPQYQVAVTKSRYATLKHLVHSIANAETAYHLANGKYTANFEELDISLPGGKLNTSTTNKYFYDWGYCDAGIDSNSVLWFGCNNTKSKLRYQMYLPSKLRICYSTVLKDDSVQAKVCNQETGDTPHKGGSWWTWHY